MSTSRRQRLLHGSNPRRDQDLKWLARVRKEGLSAFGIPKEGPRPVPPKLALSVIQFNLGQFFQCHETLEELWYPERYPLRLFYQGVLKVAVAFRLLQLGRRRGALTQLWAALDLLAPFLPRFMDVDTAHLAEQARAWAERLERGTASVSTLDAPGTRPRIRMAGVAE